MRLPLAALTVLATLALAASAAGAPIMDGISTTRKAAGAKTASPAADSRKVPVGGGAPVTLGSGMATSPSGAQPAPAAITPTGGYYITPILPAGFTVTMCAQGGGAVLHRTNGDVCQSKTPINAGTRAPAKKEEAKKE